MNPITVTAQIDAATERVWEVMSDVGRWHEWTPSIRSVRLHGGGPLALGSVAVIRQPRLPRARWRVTAHEVGRGFTWVSTAPGIRVVASHQVEPAGPGSLATLSLEHHGILGGLLRRLTREITQRYLDLEAEGLKARSEDPGFCRGGAGGASTGGTT